MAPHNRELLTLLLYATRSAALSESQRQAEIATLRSRHAHTGQATDTLKLAILSMVPTSSYRDDAFARRLLLPLVTDDVTPIATTTHFAEFLLQQLDARRCECVPDRALSDALGRETQRGQELERELQSMETSLEKERAARDKLHDELAILQDQLDALKQVEETLIQQDNAGETP